MILSRPYHPDHVPQQLWVFGYGSLVWKHDEIPHTQSLVCFARGFKRRFWHGSPDHRGTPQNVGRVVSLYSHHDFQQLDIIQEDAKQLPNGFHDPWQASGFALKVTPQHREKVISALNDRETFGYEPRLISLYSHETPTEPAKLLIETALTYIASPSDPNFLGFASNVQIANQISLAVGQSGTNFEYIANLERALDLFGYPDPHITSIMRAMPK